MLAFIGAADFAYIGVVSIGNGQLAIGAPNVHIPNTGRLVIGERPVFTVEADGAVLITHNSAKSTGSTISLLREKDINGFIYSAPLIAMADQSGETQPLLDLESRTIDGGTILGSMIVDNLGNTSITGGIGSHGVAAQTIPRTLAQATITAITDINARSAIQALANALADIGAVTIT